jgi:hypothetical protein
MKIFLWGISPLILALLLSGCATGQAPSKSGERYSLDYAPPISPVLVSASSVTVSRAQAAAKGDDLMVVGKVKRPHEVQLPGHMDLVVCTSEGDFERHETTRVSGLSSNRKGMLELHFFFRVDGLPPEGAHIRLRYHAPVSDNSGMHQCT